MIVWLETRKSKLKETPMRQILKCLMVLLMLSATQRAFAADEVQAGIAAAERLVETMQVDKQFDKLVPVITQQLMPILMNGNAAQGEELQKILTEEMVRSFAELKPDIIKMVAVIYASNFEVAEMDELDKFFKESPAGRKYLEKQDVLVQQAMAGGQQLGIRVARAAIPRVIERMKAAGMSVPEKP